MKSTPLTENQIAAVVSYLLGTELSINTALQACYIDAEEPGYFANELDSVSQHYLDERIFKCGQCGVWSKMFEQPRLTMRNGGKPACKICAMSPIEILYFDVQFVRACGIHKDLLRTGKAMGFAAILFNTMTAPSDCRLQITDADLDFLFACGIRARLSPEDAARRELVTVARKNR